jgi:uncharacterized protein YyaL (SSP411 family)
MPGFPRVLQGIATAYRERRADVDRATEQLTGGVAKVDAVVAFEGDLDGTLPGRAAEALLEHVDDLYGGLGNAPKFPNTQAFQLMLRHGVRTGRGELVEAVVLTCRRMAEGGLFDQIGGGFHRYSVDQRWLVPHFEKMLYDNAQLPRLYLEALQVTGEPLFRRTVRATLDYVLREMCDEAGGFYSATDADSEGEEGKFFVWTPAEVAELVGAEDAPVVCRYWDITDEGNFEGKSIAHVTATVDEVAHTFGRDPAPVVQVIETARQRLYAARQLRVPPLRDEKVLASWNGLMLGTFAEAGRILPEPRYVAAATAAADFLWREMRRTDRLLHVWFKGEAKIGAFLDDYVLVASGLVDLYEATHDRTHLERAGALADQLDPLFHDPEGGGFFYTAADAERLIARPKPGVDGSVPSGNGMAAVLLLRLHAFTGRDGYRQRAEELLRLYHEPTRKNPFGFASYLEALERWADGQTEVVVVGDESETAMLWQAVAERYLPNHVLVAARPQDTEPLAPARDRPAVGGRPTAYVCRGFTCSAPATDAAALAAALGGAPGA